MSKKIQLGIACGRNSEGYVGFLMDSVKKTISDLNRVEFLIGINKPVDMQLLLRNSKDCNYRILDARTPVEGSVGHGQCMDIILQNMDAEYGMMVDSDVAFLKKDWDLQLESKIEDGVVIVGAGTEKDHHHYYDFPYTIMIFFLTEALKSSGVTFVPGLKKMVLDEENADIFGRNPGDTIFQDTSWQLPLKIKGAGQRGLALPLLSPRLDSPNLKFMQPNMRGEEHQIDGEPIFTHLGRSQSRDFWHDPVVRRWKERVQDWLKGL